MTVQEYIKAKQQEKVDKEQAAKGIADIDEAISIMKERPDLDTPEIRQAILGKRQKALELTRPTGKVDTGEWFTRQYEVAQSIPYLPTKDTRELVFKIAPLVVKLKKGEELSLDDNLTLQDWYNENESDAERGRTVAADAWNIIATLPAFYGEFGIGKKLVGDAAKKVGTNIVKSILKEYSEKSFGEFAAKSAGVLASGAAMAATTGAGMSYTSAAQNYVNTEDSALKSAYKGFVDAWAENTGEQTGAAMASVFGKITKKVLPQGSKLYKAIATVDNAAIGKKAGKFLEKVGYNGTLEEMGEERFSAMMRAVLGTGEFSEVIPSGKQLATEAIAFAVPGAVGGGLQSIDAARNSVKERTFRLSYEGASDYADKNPDDAAYLAGIQSPSRTDFEKVGLRGYNQQQRQQFADQMRKFEAEKPVAVEPVAETPMPEPQNEPVVEDIAQPVSEQPVVPEQAVEVDTALQEMRQQIIDAGRPVEEADANIELARAMAGVISRQTGKPVNKVVSQWNIDIQGTPKVEVTQKVDEIIAPTEAIAPAEKIATPERQINHNAKLPAILTGAKPQYGYRDKQFTLTWSSDIDKAFYITGQKTKSKRDKEYRKFLKDNGFTDAEIDTIGQQVRDNIKSTASKRTESGNIVVPNITAQIFKPAVVKKAPVNKPVAPKADVQTVDKRPKFIKDSEGKIARVVKWDENGKPVVVYPGKDGGINPGTKQSYAYTIKDNYTEATGIDFNNAVSRNSASPRMLDLKSWRDELITDTEIETRPDRVKTMDAASKSRRETVLRNRLLRGEDVPVNLLQEFSGESWADTAITKPTVPVSEKPVQEVTKTPEPVIKESLTTEKPVETKGQRKTAQELKDYSVDLWMNKNTPEKYEEEKKRLKNIMGTRPKPLMDETEFAFYDFVENNIYSGNRTIDIIQQETGIDLQKDKKGNEKLIKKLGSQEAAEKYVDKKSDEAGERINKAFESNQDKLNDILEGKQVTSVPDTNVTEVPAEVKAKAQKAADKSGKPVYVVQKNGKYAVRATEPKGVESVRVEPKKEVAPVSETKGEQKKGKEQIRTFNGMKDRVVDAETGKPADRLTVLAGDTFQTSSGRMTTPYPKTGKVEGKANQKKINQWLIDNATEEAKSRNDDFNITIFGGEDAGNLSRSSVESMQEYLFGQQPDVQKSILKPLVRTKGQSDTLNQSTVEDKQPWEMTQDEWFSQVIGENNYVGTPENGIPDLPQDQKVALNKVGNSVLKKLKANGDTSNIKEAIKKYYSKKYNLDFEIITPSPVQRAAMNGRVIEDGKNWASLDHKTVKGLNAFMSRFMTKVDLFPESKDGIILTLDTPLYGKEIGIIRHEIEHLLDIKRGYEVSNDVNARKKEGFKDLSRIQRIRAIGKGHHKYYDAFDYQYAHRALIKESVIDGKQVPLNVLQDYAGEEWADTAIKQQSITLSQSSQSNKRGEIRFTDNGAVITLLENADASTLPHELAHFFLRDMAKSTTEQVKADMAIIRKWLNNKGGNFTTEQEERFARAFEAYLRKGKAPTTALQRVFDNFKAWLSQVYKKATDLKVVLDKDIIDVFDRMLGGNSNVLNQSAVDGGKSLGYHAGDLGKSEYLHQFTENRSTGHFGTGTYFVSSANKITGREDRPVHAIDLSGYKLYKPSNKDEAFNLHDALKKINNKARKPDELENLREDVKLLRSDLGDAIRELPADIKYANQNNPTKIRDILIDIIDSNLKDNTENGVWKWDSKKDSISTQLMKALGFEGVDVRGLPDLDNTAYGTVVYDINSENPNILNQSAVGQTNLPKRSSKYGVGKAIGTKIYVHKQYESVFSGVESAKSKLPKGFDYDIVAYDESTGSFTFSKTDDWNNNPEPAITQQIIVKDGVAKSIKQSSDPWIYHHKYLFVKDDYTGFDVQESKNRSESWINLPVDKSRIGKQSFWQQNVIPLMNNNTLYQSSGFNEKDIEIANSTSRGGGSVGANALVPRMVRQFIDKGAKILDFGAGKIAQHAESLKQDGYNVTAYEFGTNINPKLHDKDALSRQYDVVYASNVLNVQNNEAMLESTIDQIYNATKEGGTVILNLPSSPRKGAYTQFETDRKAADYLQDKLGDKFIGIRRIGGTASAPVFIMNKPEVLNQSAVEEPDTEQTSAKNKFTEEQMRKLTTQMFGDNIPNEQTKHYGDVIQNAVDKEYDKNALDIAETVISKGIILNDEQVVGLSIRALELSNQRHKALLDIAATTDANEKEMLMTQYNRIEADMAKIYNALNITGTDTSRALSVRRIMIDNANEWTLPTLLAAAEAKKGKPLTEKDVDNTTNWFNKYVEKSKEFDAVVIELRKEKATNIIDVIGKVWTRNMDKTQLKEHTQSTKAKLAELLKNGCYNG